MGDCTYVTLTILESQEKDAFPIIESSEGEPQDTSRFVGINNTKMLEWGFEEINYGDLEGLDSLKDNGIAFCSDWSKGDEYGEGSREVRFTPEGECEDKTLYADTNRIDIDWVLKEMSNNRLQTVTTLKQMSANSAVIPWSEDQVAYGKIYATLQLITPK